MKYPFKLSLLTLALTQTVFAAEIPVFQGEDIIVTATRTPQPKLNTLGDVTTISSDDIRTAGNQTLVELLQARAGIEIASTGGAGQPASIFIRGANSGHSLILIDGLRISSATTGSTALENIPLDQIDRIEVLRGPASSLYGSEAIGGVIQIFTKQGQGKPHFNATIGAGSYNTQSGSLGFSGQADDLTFAFQAGYLGSNGFSATNPTEPNNSYNPDKDAYRNSNASAKVAYRLGNGHELGATLFHSEGNAHFDSGLTTDDVNHQTLQAFSVYSRNRISDRWVSRISLGRGTDELAISGGYSTKIHTDQDQISWQNTFTTGIGEFNAGLENLNQSVTSDTTYSQTSRTIRSIFAGYLGHFDSHQLQASIRRDNNSQFGAHDTGTLAYGYQATKALLFTAKAGTAFKAPTFNDLYAPSYWGSNPNLKPEKSLSQEVGITYRIANQQLNANYFVNRIQDLIAGYPLVNVKRARIEGTELGYQGKLSDADIYARVTLQQAIDEDSGKRLRRRAAKFATLGYSQPAGAWRIGAEVVASGARFDSADESYSTRLGGYGIMSLTANYPLQKELNLTLRWNNVFNKQYELVQGYNTPGSNIFVSLQYQPR